MSNLDTIFKVPLSGGGLILLLLFSLALNTEFRVHWRGVEHDQHEQASDGVQAL